MRPTIFTPPTTPPAAAPPAAAPACCTRCGPTCGCAVPHCLDRSLVRTGERGRCRAELVPDASPVPLGVETAWTLLLADASERPVAGAEVTVDGGMPRRGDRYPGSPRVTEAASGRYRLAGLAFAAPGWWLLRLTISVPASALYDVVTFNLDLE